jgi:hypothetical protein
VGEPLAATASHARECALISYPKRMWARDALASDRLPTALVRTVERLGRDEDLLVRLVAHEGEWRERVEVSIYPRARRWRDVPIDEVASVLETRGTDGETIEKPVIAVCTHGVRDRCCALFGGRIVDALREAGGTRVEVREASHLGGDRFAPTLVMFPSGETYGHLTEADAPSLIEAALGGLGPSARFRGTMWREPIEQNADVFARERGGRVLGPIVRTRELDTRVTLRFTIEIAGQREQVELACVREERLVVGDCRSADEGRRGTVGIWRIDQ